MEEYEILMEQLLTQKEALRQLIWVLNKNFNEEDFKQNILLIGDRGSGKTTMLEHAASIMEIPMGEVYNMFDKNGYNVDLFWNGYFQMLQQCQSYGREKGILLLHDFQDSFIYGHSTEFNAMLASGFLRMGDSGLDVSKIIFVGEIDTNNVRDIFLDDVFNLYDINKDVFSSPTLNIIRDYLTTVNEIKVGEDGEKIADVRLDKYLADSIKFRFLSSTCSSVFPRKIQMHDMDTSEITKALISPVSILNGYKSDLSDEYINSKEFIEKVAYYIVESVDGLHAASKAIEAVALSDFKQNPKVLKKGSLLFH